MKAVCLSLLLTTFIATASAAQPDPAKTRAYIDKAWSTLTRSQDECKSLVDPKIKTRPVMYIPAQFTAPKDLTCKPARWSRHPRRAQI